MRVFRHYSQEIHAREFREGAHFGDALLRPEAAITVSEEGSDLGASTKDDPIDGSELAGLREL